MQVKIQREQGITVISMHGRLDGSTVWQIIQKLDCLHDSSCQTTLHLDFCRVRRWERFGVALLAKSIKSLRGQFRDIKLIRMDNTLAELFGSVGLKNNVLAASSR